jgi:hypothetical protein
MGNATGVRACPAPVPGPALDGMRAPIESGTLLSVPRQSDTPRLGNRLGAAGAVTATAVACGWRDSSSRKRLPTPQAPATPPMRPCVSACKPVG